jgi:hypothetical protein
MTRRALIVGINDYEFAPLKGCVNDAIGMRNVLSKHENEDNDENFACRLLVSSEIKVTKARLTKEIESLFSREGDIALLYFSGHGAKNDLGSFLVTQDATKYNEGISLSQLIQLANAAKNVREVFIILDSCYSGQMGNSELFEKETAILRKGVSILSSSLENEYSLEKNGEGLFTSIVIEALNGGAADIIGNVTSTGIYNYVDKILGPWDQRPVFKSHISKLTALKKCKPIIPRSTLTKIINYFSDIDTHLQLDSSFEPSLKPQNEENEKIFKDLQRLVSASLVVPVEEDHMYYAAKNKKTCKLTSYGKLYWRILKKKELCSY